MRSTAQAVHTFPRLGLHQGADLQSESRSLHVVTFGLHFAVSHVELVSLY